MIKYFILCLLCLNSSVSFSQTEELSMKNLFASFEKNKNSQQKFIEQQFDSFLEIKMDKSGYLKYQYPSNLTQYYLSPIKGEISFTDKSIKINFPSRKIILPLDNTPVLAMFSQTLLSLLNGDLKKISKLFVVNFNVRTNNNWTLNLEPKNKFKKYLDSIVVQGKYKKINDILITQNTGDWRKIYFQDMIE